MTRPHVQHVNRPDGLHLCCRGSDCVHVGGPLQPRENFGKGKCRGCNHAIGNTKDNPDVLRRLAEIIESAMEVSHGT